MTGKFLSQALIQSGTILSFAQSPPPITLPALTEQTLIFDGEWLEKNDSKYDLKTNSAEPFEALYGSLPPSLSDSLYPHSHSLFS